VGRGISRQRHWKKENKWERRGGKEETVLLMLSWHRWHPVSLGQARSLTIYLCVCLCRWPTLWRPSAVWCLQPWWWFMPKGAASKVSPHFGYFLHLLWVSGVCVFDQEQDLFLNKTSYIFCRLWISLSFLLSWLSFYLSFSLRPSFSLSVGVEQWSHIVSRGSVSPDCGEGCVYVCVNAV